MVLPASVVERVPSPSTSNNLHWLEKHSSTLLTRFDTGLGLRRPSQKKLRPSLSHGGYLVPTHIVGSRNAKEGESAESRQRER